MTKLEKIQMKQLADEYQANQSRARSVTVGTAFGGTTEVSMRAPNGTSLWCLLQPVEVTELIHQLAANIGCHLQLAPRDDFSSWRNWRVTEHQHKHLQGHPAFPNDMEPHHNVGTDKFSLEDQRRSDSFFPPEMVKNAHEKEFDNVVAAQETIDRRTSERAPTSS
jgi:hypothetical protein